MYKLIPRRLIHIDDLIRECGLFVTSNLNGGYGCRSKSKLKNGEGICMSYNCPLAIEADLAELKKFDKWLYEDYKETHRKAIVKCSEQDFPIPGWMIQYRVME